MSEKKEKNPKERILEAASNLFYVQGFDSTGINQIIEESETFKKSFYTYFQDKNSLALSYLEIQEKELIELLTKMIHKHKDYTNFVKAWVNLQRKKMTSNSYRGCPFALFSNQSIKNRELFQDKIQNIFKNWEELLIHFIESLQKKNKFPQKKDPKLIVKKIILYYEGVGQAYSMTRDPIYIKLLEEELLSLKN